MVTDQELVNASKVAIGDALGCPGGARDIEIRSVTIFNKDGSDAETGTSTTSTSAPPDPPESGVKAYQEYLHRFRATVEISFTAMIANPDLLNIDQIAGEIRHPAGLKPRLWVAYTDRTSFSDMYVKIVQVAYPDII